MFTFDHLVFDSLARYVPFEMSLQKQNEIIHCDVAVIGGGSSGTYAAVRLKDEGKNVVVIEAQDRLGGHTETYDDKATGQSHDVGVFIYGNDPLVFNYTRRLGVELGPAPLESAKPVYFDFSQGKLLDGYQPVKDDNALERWVRKIAEYPFLEEGGLDTIPEDVPKDLLLPLDQFLEKHDIGDPAFLHHDNNQGVGDALKQITLYVAKLMNRRTFEWIAKGFVRSVQGRNSEIYEKAFEVLGDSVLLQSRVISSDRSGSKPRITVQTPAGVKVIEAQKLLITIPLVPENLQSLDLSVEESGLFSKLKANAFYTGIMRNTGLPGDIRVDNVGEHRRYKQPKFPGAYAYKPAYIDGMFDIKYGAEEVLPVEVVKANILEDMRSLQRAGVIASEVNVEATEFVRLVAHDPYTPMVSPEEIRNGFYKKLFALQGERNTYFTGAAWAVQESSILWRFTEETILPRVLANEKYSSL